MRSKAILIFISLLALYGCANEQLAPVTEGWQQPLSIQGWHKVQPGETLYSIAWAYGRDYRDLAEINQLDSPEKIRVGQRLSLMPLPEKKTQRTKRRQQKAQASRKQASRPRQKASTSKKSGAVHWHWPAQGKVIKKFKEKGNNGIDIAGQKNAPVYAAAKGEVVYSGNNLRGYGNMIIIKHNPEYLSAYAHNSKLLVKEGDSVKAGQLIARMGDSDARKVKLHFEIRRAGKPRNPLRLLPSR